MYFSMTALVCLFDFKKIMSDLGTGEMWCSKLWLTHDLSELSHLLSPADFYVTKILSYIFSPLLTGSTNKLAGLENHSCKPLRSTPLLLFEKCLLPILCWCSIG